MALATRTETYAFLLTVSRVHARNLRGKTNETRRSKRRFDESVRSQNLEFNTPDAQFRYSSYRVSN